MLVKGTVGDPFFSICHQYSTALDEGLQARFPKWFKGGEKGGTRSIQNRIVEDEKYWDDLIYTVCNGNISNMRDLKRVDIYEFFEFVENVEKDGRANRTKNNR